MAQPPLPLMKSLASLALFAIQRRFASPLGSLFVLPIQLSSDTMPLSTATTCTMLGILSLALSGIIP